MRASPNYYFTLTLFLILASLAWLWIYIRQGYRRTWAFGDMSLGWLANLVAVGSVLTGLQGILSTRHLHASMTATVKCLKQQGLLESLFISSSYLSPPWMVPARQHFVIHYNHPMDRALEISMEGGVGGLIDKGYFATLAEADLRRGQAPIV